MPDATYFTVEEARALPPLGDGEEFTTDAIAAARSEAEEALESEAACNVAFVPREAVEVHSAIGTSKLDLGRARIRTVVSATNHGQAINVSDVVIQAGRAVRPGGWPAGTGNLVVTYLHGYDQPPARIKRAALVLCRHYLAGVDDVHERATRAEAGQERIWLAPHEPFGIPEVDAAVRDYREPQVLVA